MLPLHFAKKFGSKLGLSTYLHGYYLRLLFGPNSILTSWPTNVHQLAKWIWGLNSDPKYLTVRPSKKISSQPPMPILKHKVDLHIQVKEEKKT